MNKFEFPVTIYGKIEKYNDVLSKARCRIFYKYGNRNGTYITDEFAEKLLRTLPYTPVKGIYEYDDFTDHGVRRSEGRIYGIVPENPNITWESHLDEDGVERIYACADTLIFTALYAEANDIVGKSQSMELYEPSLKYHSEIKDGQKYIVFDEGGFLGLQVLGDDVEPCFEGASFFSLQENIEKVIKKIQEIESIYTKNGGAEMMKVNFKLSDSQKHDALWTLLNPEYNEEGNWTITYAICDIFDDYALCYNYETCTYERVQYTKNDETDLVELGEKTKVYIIDVTENERQTVETLRQLNGGTYELVNEDLSNVQNLKEENSKFSSKIEELNGEISTLQSEKAGIETKYSEAQDQIQTLTEENTSLNEYKTQAENEKKDGILAEYENVLGEDVIDTYRSNCDKYTVSELDKELAYEVKKIGFSAFSKVDRQGLMPKDEPLRGVEAVLAKYVK